jgi:hypothetical protein
MASYYSKREAASRLGVSVKTLDRRIKRGDYARTIVHGPHGPEIRVLLDDEGGVVEGTAAVVPATDDDTTTHDTSAAVQGFAPPTNALDRMDTRGIDVPDPDVHRALAAALRDALAANRAWAHRYDTLAAEVESLRRPWWRKGWEKVGRRRKQ